MNPQKSRWWSKLTRDLLLFSLGVVFSIHEVLLRSGPERPETLIFISFLLGAPIALRYDERRRDRHK